MNKPKYVWMNTRTGEFSNTWSEDGDLFKIYTPEELKTAFTKDGWRLIKFECLNDDNFEFTNKMKLK